MSSKLATVVDFDEAQREYAGKIRTFAYNSYRQLPGYTREDVEQELLVVLWKTCLSYDPNRGASFNTRFQGNARNHIITLIRRANTQSRKAAISSLSEAAVVAAVESIARSMSAEDQAILRMDVQEAVFKHGSEVLNGTGRGRKRKLA